MERFRWSGKLQLK